MGEGMGVNVFEMGLNISLDLKPQVCYRAQKTLAPETGKGLHKPQLLNFGVK